MTDLDHKVRELRALAEKATPGEWGVEDPMDHGLTIVSNPRDPAYDWKHLATLYWPDEDDHLVNAREVNANASYIAAANPATLTAILDEYDRRGAALKTICTERCDPHQVAHEALSREVGK